MPHNPWIRVSLILFLALLVRIALADQDESASSPVTSAATSKSSSIPKLILTLGPGMAVHSGNYSQLYNSGSLGYGLNATVVGQVTDAPLYAGLDFALDFWGFDSPAGAALPSGSTLDRSLVGIQLTPTILYRFDPSKVYGIYPYFGFSVGPHFQVFRQRTIDTVHSAIKSTSDTSVLFELLVRPGVDFQLTDVVAINVESKFGVLDWDFIFLPQVNFVLSL